MYAKLKTYGKIFFDSFRGWISIVAFVFSIFAVFSVVVSLFHIGLSSIFQYFIDFYDGFRNNIFWPISKIFSLQIPDIAKDVILFWAISGAIATHAILWFTSKIHDLAKTTYANSLDPAKKRNYISQHGQEQYKAELSFVKKQLDETKLPENKFIFGIVSAISAIVVGPLGFIYVFVVNPKHETIPLSGRGFLLFQVIALFLVLIVFFVLNFLLPPATPITSR